MSDPFTPEQVSTIDRITRRAGIGVVYIIAHDAAGPVKVGKSTFLATRLDSLQTGNPNRLHVYAAYLIQHGGIQIAESRLHAALNEAWLIGEWFSLSVLEATAACKRALRLANHIQSADQKSAKKRSGRVQTGTFSDGNKKPTNYKRLRERRLAVLRGMYPERTQIARKCTRHVPIATLDKEPKS